MRIDDPSSTKRAIVGLPPGEVRSVRLIRWAPGVQGVDFIYADGRQVALPIEQGEDEYEIDDRSWTAAPRRGE